MLIFCCLERVFHLLNNRSYRGFEMATADQTESITVEMSVDINDCGHVQELERQFGLLSISAVGIVTGCSWALMGGTIVSGYPHLTRLKGFWPPLTRYKTYKVVSILNGGPPGILYEL